MPDQKPEHLAELQDQQLVVLYRKLLAIEERALREMRESAAASTPAVRASYYWQDIAPLERLVEVHRARLARRQAARSAQDPPFGREETPADPESDRQQGRGRRATRNLPGR